jgi:hypothetical protein
MQIPTLRLRRSRLVVAGATLVAGTALVAGALIPSALADTPPAPPAPPAALPSPPVPVGQGEHGGRAWSLATTTHGEGEAAQRCVQLLWAPSEQDLPEAPPIGDLPVPPPPGAGAPIVPPAGGAPVPLPPGGDLPIPPPGGQPVPPPAGGAPVPLPGGDLPVPPAPGKGGLTVPPHDGGEAGPVPILPPIGACGAESSAIIAASDRTLDKAVRAVFGRVAVNGATAASVQVAVEGKDPVEATMADGGDAAPGQYFVAFVPADATVTSVTAFDAEHEQIAQATKVPAVELPELPALPEPPPVPAKG